MPRKVFVAGEVLTAADVNTNLMDQSVMVFADSGARGSAIGSAVEGMVTYLEDTDQLEVYGGTATGWTSASNVLFGTAVPSDGQVVTYSTAVSGYVPADTAVAAGSNLLYNGAMQVAQRGTSETGITDGGYYTADRWVFRPDNLGTWTQTVEADGPTGSGFTKSLKVECTTADGSPAAGDRVDILQRIEGQDLQGIKKGTSSAQSLTLSFWVKSDTTGTYIAELFDTDNTRQISASYTISSADTWENKTITFAGDTSGVLDNDNAASLVLTFWLAAGSNYTSGTLNTSWAANSNADRAVGQTNLAASTSNYWQVTGVQLETGTVATGFEHKAYGTELAECQRYYQIAVDHDDNNKSIGTGQYLTTTQIRLIINLATTMRISPAISINSSGNYYRVASATGSDDISVLTVALPGKQTVELINTTQVSGTAGHACSAYTLASGGKIAFDAEL